MNSKIEKLIKQFAKLPRLGSRAATRIVLFLLQGKNDVAENLIASLSDAVNSVRPCPICGALTDKEKERCEICSDSSRSNGQLCIVRDLSDVWVLEKSAFFHGRYHILGGLLSGINGTTTADLNLSVLPERILKENIKEIIFALPNTVEGKTTQHYVMSVIGSNNNVKFTELASGVPLGGDLDYLDDGTLALAFGGRRML